MANTKTAKKQIQVSKRNHERNVAVKSRLKSMLKRARQAIAEGQDAAAATDALNQAVKTLYKSATKGIIKKQNASRRVGRLMLSFNRAFNADGTPVAPAVQAKPAPAPKAGKGKAQASKTATSAATAAAPALTAAPETIEEQAPATPETVEATAAETEAPATDESSEA
jgi:small subunit ribosomal protein S20